MTNLTPLYWRASGVSLHTHRWAITTKAGTRAAVPSRRGENVQLPFRIGAIQTKKYKDQRVLSLPMWVSDVDENGNKNGAITREEQLQDNWNALMKLLDTEEEFPLEKRWYDNNVVKVATAQAELLEPPEPSVLAKNVWGTTVELLLADPYFYYPVAAQPVGPGLVIEGDANTRHVVLVMGAGETVTISSGNWIRYDGYANVTVDCFNCTAIKNNTGEYVNGLIVRNPKWTEWMELHPGIVNMTRSGAATIAYDAAWK